MKKNWAKIGHIAIATMLASAFLFPVLSGAANIVAPISASAELEETPIYSRLDDNFEIAAGAAVNSTGTIYRQGDATISSVDHDTALTKLKYSMYLRNPDLYDFIDHSKDSVVLQWTIYKDAGSVSGVDKDSEDGRRKAEKKFSVACFWNSECIMWMHKVVEYDEDLPFNGLLEFTENQKVVPEGAIVVDYSEDPTETVDGYTVDWMMLSKDGGRLRWDDDGEVPELGFFIQINSPFSEYFIDFEYCFKNYVRTKDYWIFGKEEVYTETTGHLTSDVRSIQRVLKGAQDAGTLEAELACRYPNVCQEGCTEVLDKALEILGIEPKPVKIEYLKRIEGTPFAEKVQETITIPAAQNQVYKDDVATALGTGALTALNSYIREFEYDEETGVHRAEYHSNIWIEARDMEGHTYNYVLDCGKSYYDYYNELKNDCGFSEDMYDYMLGQIIKKYDVLSNYTDAEHKIYGYFGYTVIPDQPLFGSFDSMWEEMFGSNKKTTGGIQMFAYVGYLSSGAYDTLLARYGHSWLNKAWDQVVSGGGELEEFEATHYFFWVEDISMDRVIFSENGSVASGNTNGIMQNEATEVVKDVAAELGVNTSDDTWDELQATFIEVAKGILTATLIAGVSILGVSILFKLFKRKVKAKEKKQPKKGKSKPKKPKKKKQPKKGKSEPKSKEPKEPKEPKDKQ